MDLDAALRQDVRHFTSWAIDSAETREVDDAVGLETLADGRQRVWIHVADPTCRLREDSALAAEASRRTSTLYIPTGTTHTQAHTRSTCTSSLSHTFELLNCHFVLYGECVCVCVCVCVWEGGGGGG